VLEINIDLGRSQSVIIDNQTSIADRIPRGRVAEPSLPPNTIHKQEGLTVIANINLIEEIATSPLIKERFCAISIMGVDIVLPYKDVSLAISGNRDTPRREQSLRLKKSIFIEYKSAPHVAEAPARILLINKHPPL
jgi:hypothetical protein